MIFSTTLNRRSKTLISLHLILLCILNILILICPINAAQSKEKKKEYREIIKASQGDVFEIRISLNKTPTSVVGRLEDNIIPFVKNNISFPEEVNEYIALVGIDLSQKPKVYKLNVEVLYENGTLEVISYKIKVIPAKFRVQNLKLPKEMVELDKETLLRVENEKKIVSEVFSKLTDSKIWTGNFIMPVEGEISHQFGSRRIMNGEPRNPHNGEDIKSKMGTPVHASNDGIVTMVDDHFFSGKGIIIDHGLGVFTMYFHLSESQVKIEDMVKKGDVIGSVEMSGRATGPHLHWGLRVNGARVNPIAITKINLE